MLIPNAKQSRKSQYLCERTSWETQPTRDEHGRVEGHLLRKLQDAVQGSAVEKIKMHSFRDTFATNKIRDHEDIRTVQKWLGHKDVNETMRYSAWLDSQRKGARDAANREDTRYKAGTNGD